MGNDSVAQGGFEKAAEGRCGKVDSGGEWRFRFQDRLFEETSWFDPIRNGEVATVGRVQTVRLIWAPVCISAQWFSSGTLSGKNRGRPRESTRRFQSSMDRPPRCGRESQRPVLQEYRAWHNLHETPDKLETTPAVDPHSPRVVDSLVNTAVETVYFRRQYDAGPDCQRRARSS